MHKTLDGKRALVTGGGRGIGRAIALAMAVEGASVAVLARTGDQVDAVAEEIAQLGSQALAVRADLSRDDEVEAGIAQVLAPWGGIDILVNNAGMLGPVGLTQDLDPELWKAMFQVNLFSCFRCAQLVLPGMIERNRGKIINLSGGGAVDPRPRFSAYAASKAGVVRFTETLAAEVAELNIDVNAIAPGAIHTMMVDELLNASAAEEERAEAQQIIDDEQSPDRAAALAVFLASSRSDGLSGRLISAIWDDWENLDIGAVMSSDRFTVRRLT
jgi:NAD(P)-dependent dehydrogenase (short-subunit alcohol dehydrogenase family)